MTPRERLIKTLNHQHPDRFCVDLGAGGQTGIGATALHHLNQSLLTGYNKKVKIIEPYQMPGEFKRMIRIFRFLAISILVVFVTSISAQNKDFRGSISKIPAQHWEDGFVTANGRMGAILFGNPGDETFVANHCRLYLPLGNREIVPDLAKDLPELRNIIQEKGYGKGMDFFLDKAKQQGYPGIIPTDPFHPGFFINIRHKTEGTILNYQRTENFATGEVEIKWSDKKGEYSRKFFVSRTENLIVMLIAGATPEDVSFQAINHNLIKSQLTVTPDLVTYHNTYLKGKGGYDAVIKVLRNNNNKEILVLARIVPWKTPLSKERSEAWAYSSENPDFKKIGDYNPTPKLAESSVVTYQKSNDADDLLPKVIKGFENLKTDYASLFNSHKVVHEELFNRVTLNLNSGEERTETTESLLEKAQKEDRLPAALMEKMYDAGRYMFICSAGELCPNLHGLWTGSWEPAWSGDFTLDTNVQAAMASACSANLSDLMEGYFRLMESFIPDWQLNAQRIYGCRGILTNARASNTALMLHWGRWPGVFWTSGCGWLASFFTDYAQYTNDKEFLRTRCLPMLKQIAQFNEDFLTQKDKNNKLVFIPGYNPETGSCTNPTVDIAITRQVLTNLIAICKELKTEKENLPKWETLFKNLPNYSINKDGEIPEYPSLKVVAGHRHHSQLYPCFQSFDPAFENNAALRLAAQKTIKTKIAAIDANIESGGNSSFGRMQCAVSAAFLKMPEEAYGRLKIMATKRSMNNSLITSHDPNASIFNTDGNGAIPQVVNTMLAFSQIHDGSKTNELDQITLLPALSKEWPNGSVNGIRLRGGYTLNLSWTDGKVAKYEIFSDIQRSVIVCLQGKRLKVQTLKITK